MINFSTFLFIIVMQILLLPLLVFADQRPLVGVVTYPVWQGNIWDEITLTPPKWSYRLPYFADVRDDSSRLVRTGNTEQEIVYHLDNDITNIVIYSAFNDAENCVPESDIALFISQDGAAYSPQPLTFRKINYAVNWQKVILWTDVSTAAIRYVKIRIIKTNGTQSNPQIMRVDINYKAVATDNPFKSVLIDNMNDFGKMDSHTPNLSFATDNPSLYRLVTGIGYSPENVNQQILYAKSAHIDYFAVLYMYPNGPDCLPLFIDAIRLSPYKNDIKYCLIAHMPRTNGTWTEKVAQYIEFFKDSNYVKVLDGRPLLYLFDPARNQYTTEEINQLRAASEASGTGNPYVVGMGEQPCGLDAGSDYLPGPGVSTNYAGTNATIPCVSFGANTLPRIDNPPSWGTFDATDAETHGRPDVQLCQRWNQVVFR